MTLASAAIAVAVIFVVLSRRIRGEAVPAPKKLFLLPIIVGAIGLEDLSKAKPNAIAIGVIAVGSVLSLGLGLFRGHVDKVSFVNGAPYMAWGTWSVAVFAVNVLLKLALDIGGVSAGGTKAALSSSILLSLGLTLFGEAAMVWLRAQSLYRDAAGGQYRGSVPDSDRPTFRPPVR